MSRIGLKPITIKDNVKVEITKGGAYGNLLVKVSGPKGELTQDIRNGVEVNFDETTKTVNLSRKNDERQTRAYHGLYRALINNMVEGVTEGYIVELEVHGVGYRAKLNGNRMEFNVGYNHPVVYEAPAGIEFELSEETNIKVKGIDKRLVGETAAQIKAIRKPEPYKGKGIRYKGEQIKRKVGKTAAK